MKVVGITDDRPVLITGGAGFIGTNLAARLAASGRRVLVYDDLSRSGVAANLAWLEARHPGLVEVEIADVRDPWHLARAVRRSSAVFHLAAQVAVTTSIADPGEDFEVNARGTLNVLQALRSLASPPPLLYTSTNKVYGALADVALETDGRRHRPVDAALARAGIDEDRPLDFYSPYGCSKGCADQYVRDHARIYGLPAVVFRMSCIYGPHQCGSEDQGWVAHFLLQALAGRPIVIYGDGRQVRDALYVDDLVAAMLLALRALTEAPAEVAGRCYNIGGGPANAVSLLEVLDLIAAITGRSPEVSFGSWRPGDQRYYVSACERFQRATGWAPETQVGEGLARLHRALTERAAAEAAGEVPAPSPGAAAPAGPRGGAAAALVGGAAQPEAVILSAAAPAAASPDAGRRAP